MLVFSRPTVAAAYAKPCACLVRDAGRTATYYPDASIKCTPPALTSGRMDTRQSAVAAAGGAWGMCLS
jgi:hypothetical protein